MTELFQPPPKSLPPGSRLYAYMRDSGGEAQEQSVQQQHAQILVFCKIHGFTLEKEFIDEAKSGGSVAGRDGFLAMFEDIQSSPNPPDGILYWNLARFSREIDDAAFYKAVIRRLGIQIHSLTDPIPDGEMGRIFETFIDLANHEKRIQTSRDVIRALHQQVENGYTSGGKPCVGYLAEPVVIGTKRNGAPRTVSRLVIDPAKVADVVLAWSLRAAGKSYREIAEATGNRLFRSKNSWSSFFKNRTYLGIGKCGSLEVPDHHPAIIDQQTWDAVQAIENAHPRRKQSGQVNHPRRQSSPSLLSGVAVCEICGAAMVYNRANPSNPWPSYVCGKKQRQGATI